MKNPDWFVLIEQWIPEKMGVFGITLPFLVGALAYKNDINKPDIVEVKKVLSEICNKPIDGYVIEVADCDDINAPVLRARRCDSPFRIDRKIAITHPSGEGQSLVFGSGLSTHWQSTDAKILVDRLAEDAAQHTEKGQYSRRRNPVDFSFEYGDFSPTEFEYIKRTIMTS